MTKDDIPESSGVFKPVGVIGFAAERDLRVALVQLYRDLSDQGHHWLVVFAPEDEQAARVAAIARRSHAKLAQKYNPLVIEELI